MRINTHRIILLAILYTLLMCCSSFTYAASQIQIRGLENNKKLRTYVEQKVLPLHQEKDVNAYALKTDTLKALKANGYYSATVIVDVTKHQYILVIDPANVYRISAIKFEGYDYKHPINIAKNDILAADAILAAQKDIFASVKSDNCFYELSVHHEIILNPNLQTADLTFRILTGPQASFGKTSFAHLENIKADYIRDFMTYKEHECWDPDKIDETKAAFMKVGLFSYIKAELPDTPGPDGKVDITYDFVEAPPRSIRVGVNHQSDTGPGILTKWSHKNIFSRGEGLTLDLRVSPLAQSLQSDFSKPHFFNNHRDLTVSALLEHTNSDAFEQLTLNINSKIKNQLSSTLTTSVGLAAELSEVQDEGKLETSTETFALISLPVGMTYDTRDNKLDSHNGVFSQTTIEPFGDVLRNTSPFVRLNLTNSIYFDLNDIFKFDPVLAFRGNVGNIYGDRTTKIPASKRYYAGGGSSIRGVEYQRAGPLVNGDPAGGKSLIEVSSELRLKITDTIGIATFVDAGNVYDDFLPDFKDGLFVGTGVGLRYFTGFGPIRADIAFPVNKLEEQKQSYQFYVSLGQSF